MTNAFQQKNRVTRSGLRLDLRPAQAEDEAPLEEFFRHVSADDLHFRFLSAAPRVAHDVVVAMTHVDHHQTENFLAFEANTGLLVATAMLACDKTLERGEVAIAERADFKGRGIGWALLQYVTDAARARGVKMIESIESRDNHAAIELESEMGFSVEACPGDATLLVVRKYLQPV
ncbi:MAG: GNAT family N-acetyltransferase [Candidatus Sphingomonas colombiensis]|nr:GNAT family N-acetyltransferase [Sphingomonas sp.]WEK43231.1 MAG: GNAT family N-acetyltransferase [Sphingomonas sp.]